MYAVIGITGQVKTVVDEVLLTKGKITRVVRAPEGKCRAFSS